MTAEGVSEKYNLIIGRHCLVKSPHFLPGAVREALSYGANSLMIYSGAPQNSSRRPLSELKIPEFKKLLVENHIAIDNVIVHGPYLVNLANTLDEKIFHWSAEFLKQEILRTEEIGVKTIIIHPGSALSAEPKSALLQVARGINIVLKNTLNIRIALETTCGRGGEVGKNFEELKFIVDKVEQQERVGVCWDTCHLYASGYDIKDSLDEVIADFEKKIGLEKLWVIHVNDSMFELGKKMDRHQNIGHGKIGFDALKRVVWHPKFSSIIKLLETPRKDDYYREEIKMLKKTD